MEAQNGNAKPVRPQLLYEAFSKCQGMEELPDGYALRFSGKDWIPKLQEIERVSPERWPAMTFSVVEPAGQDEIRLEIRGPEGTKRFVESANEIVTTYLNPKPSRSRAIRNRYASVTSRLRVLPDFLIIGAKKSGTTSLYWYLTQHPSVMPATHKEVNFFHLNYHRGMNWYRRFFPTVMEKQARSIRGRPAVTGEATPDYIFFPIAAARIVKELPEARLIALLRNPVDRAYSAYHHRVRRGVEKRAFPQVVQEEIEGRGDRASRKKGSYLGKGDYAAYLKHWFDRFPRDQLLVLATEELAQDPARTVGTAFQHLGLPEHELRQYRKQNAVPYPSMEPVVRERLTEFFKPRNERLYELLGRDLDWDR